MKNTCCIDCKDYQKAGEPCPVKPGTLCCEDSSPLCVSLEECQNYPCGFFNESENGQEPEHKLNKNRSCYFREVIDALREVTSYLEESHYNEHQTNHYGDGPEGCSYCEAIKRSDELVKIFENFFKINS